MLCEMQKMGKARAAMCLRFREAPLRPIRMHNQRRADRAEFLLEGRIGRAKFGARVTIRRRTFDVRVRGVLLGYLVNKQGYRV